MSLADMLRENEFEELLRRLDDPEERERLLDELDDEQTLFEGNVSTMDPMVDAVAQDLWEEVAVGRRTSSKDNPLEATLRGLATDLSIQSGWKLRLLPIRWGQVALGAGLATVVALIIFTVSPGRSVPQQPTGTFIAMVERDVIPIARNEDVGTLDALLDQFSQTALKGSGLTSSEEELLKLLLIYRPSEAEIEAARAAIRQGAAELEEKQ